MDPLSNSENVKIKLDSILYNRCECSQCLYVRISRGVQACHNFAALAICMNIE